MLLTSRVSTSHLPDRGIPASSVPAVHPSAPTGIVEPGLVSNDEAAFSTWDQTADDPNDTQTDMSRGMVVLRWLCEAQADLPHVAPLEFELIGEFVSHGAERFPVSLAEALYDLDQVTEEAGEEGFPAPSEKAVQNAKRLLRQMFHLSNRRYEIYPTQDGEVAIDAPDGPGRSVLLLCDSNGGALCMVNLPSGHRRARYFTTDMLPDGFVREALNDLERQDD